MLPDRATFLRSVAAVLLVAAIGLLFIASYVGPLHDPKPHGVPVAVFGPPRLAAALQGSSALKVVREPDEAAARRAIDRRDAYGAVIAGYLATSLLSIAFGPRPGRMRVAWRMGSVALLGVLMGAGGALLGHAIGGFGGSLLVLLVWAALGAAVALAFGDRPTSGDPEVEATMAAAAAAGGI